MKFIPTLAALALLTGALRAQTTMLDEVVVTATPLERTLFQQAQPVSILTGPELTLKLEPTLGETLNREPGISSTYFGPAASRPIIRGLDGDRIRVLQNGSNTIDASATSPDHAVSFDPVSAQSIEIVRGPATLLYGPNAIGGVVNVLDNRIPTERIDEPVRGSVEGRYGSVNTERGGAFLLEGGLSGFNWHLEGYKRATDELHIPGFARSDRLREREPLEDGEKEPRDVLPNSDLRTEGLSGGLSYAWDKGFIGLAYSGFNTNYGTVAEPDVTIDLEQRRWDARGEIREPLDGISAIRFNIGLSDYQHTEFERAEVGTVFENEGYDGRIEIAHAPLGPLEGAVGYQTERSNFSALGEEAFLPPVETNVHSGFVFEEWVIDPRWRLQFGGRYDHVTVDSDGGEAFGPARGRTFDNLSASSGVIFTPVEAYAIALNAAFTQRAPSYQELFANGPHVATDAFEIGAPDLSSEQAFSIDLSLRKKLGRVTGALTGFYYEFRDFVGLFGTGEIEDDLPVFAYRATDARFFGGEAEVTFHLIEPPTVEEAVFSKDAKTAMAPVNSVAPQSLDLILTADYVHATDTQSDTPLPRIPPFRAGAELSYRWDRFSAGIEGQYSARQNRTAEFELPTDSYFLVNARVGYRVPIRGYDLDVYVRGVNLTNEEARLHTSFLKDIAPLGGRGIVVGMKAEF